MRSTRRPERSSNCANISPNRNDSPNGLDATITGVVLVGCVLASTVLERAVDDGAVVGDCASARDAIAVVATTHAIAIAVKSDRLCVSRIDEYAGCGAGTRDQGLDIRRCGMCQHLMQRTELFDATGAHDGDPVGETGCFAQVMRDEHRGKAER